MRHMMNSLEVSHAPTAPASLFGRLAAATVTVWQRYLEHRRLTATVRSLGALDDRTLKDIGLARSEIESVVMTGSRDRKISRV